MNTYSKTILNIKTNKTLKKKAQEVAIELGIPLGTAVNAFLKQFVREKEITLSSNVDVPNSYLQKIIIESENEYLRGESNGPYTREGFINHLKNL